MLLIYTYNITYYKLVAIPKPSSILSAWVESALPVYISTQAGRIRIIACKKHFRKIFFYTKLNLYNVK